MRIFNSINPYTLQTIAEFPELSVAQVDAKIDKANNCFKDWRRTSFDQRAKLLLAVAILLRRDKDALALLITKEMGKITSEAVAEVEKSASNLEYYAYNAEKLLADTVVDLGLYRSMISYDPIGVVFAIMPWNYPFWQVLRYTAPCIMAGNTTILKHASNVFGCAKAIENIFLEAGAPEGLFQSIEIGHDNIEKIIAHDAIQLVTLTGSERAGSAIASLAGKHIKKSIMELGGSDPFIVLADADLQKAAEIATKSRMMNAGQACICAKRFIVESSVIEEFTALFAHNISLLKQGDPLNHQTQLGPLARVDLAVELSNQMKNSLNQGAELLVGGQIDNCNFAPTLLTRVNADNVAFREETFGPLACVTEAKNADDAIEKANNHRYGLGGTIWTKDLDRGYKLARKLETGNVFVNSMVRSDSRISFGGVKKSGFGRELGELGIKELTNQKAIIIEE